jgi:hypothetical protein
MNPPSFDADSDSDPDPATFSGRPAEGESSMPTFDTPTPITVTVDFVVGHLQVIAGDRADTVVDVQPSDGSSAAAKEAEKATVEFADGNLTIKVPKPSRAAGWFTKTGSVDVSIQLPAGSNLRGDAAMGSLRSEGRLGQCRFRVASGDITLAHVEDAAEVTTWNGQVRIAEVGGRAEIENGNGSIWVGSAGGDLRLSTANGSLTVDRAGANVSAKTANGSIRIGEVATGSVVLNSASGELEVGIAEGTAAWLDVSSWSGEVRNRLGSTDRPEPTDRTVDIQARTYHGDILIRRSTSAAATKG